MIVAPDKYRDLARQLVHDISNQQAGFQAAYWTPKMFVDNEAQFGGSIHTIFIGDERENELTGDFLSIMGDLHERAGACYAYDGNKAVIFGTGKAEQARDFGKMVEQIVKEAKHSDAKGSVGAALAVLVLQPWMVVWAGLGIFLPGLIGLPFLGWWIVKRRSDIERLRRDQTRVALSLFMKEVFDEWSGGTGKQVEHGVL